MAIIIIFIALVVERFFDWSHLRRWRWFEKSLAWLGKRSTAWPVYVVFALAVLPPVLIVAALNHFLAGHLYGVLKLIFGVLVLIYCLGPMNFWAEAYACIGAVKNGDEQLAMGRAKKSFGLTVFDNPQAFHRALTNALFSEANCRVFAVLFWFLLLGPAGALLYRLVDLCCVPGLTITRFSVNFQLLLDWLPVRIFTLFFALGGHFKNVIKHWKHDALTPPKLNSTLLSESGVAALDVLEAERIPEDGSAEKETIDLLDRVFVIGLVVLAIVVLA
jgi:AmpE protein